MYVRTYVRTYVHTYVRAIVRTYVLIVGLFATNCAHICNIITSNTPLYINVNRFHIRLELMTVHTIRMYDSIYVKQTGAELRIKGALAGTMMLWVVLKTSTGAST